MLERKSMRCLFILGFLLALFNQSALAQDLKPAQKDAVSFVEASKAKYDEIATYIFKNPELSLVEFKSSAKLMDYLSDNGFSVKKGIGGMPTSFVATWGSGTPVIGFLAEFDALPGLSQKLGVAATRAQVVEGGPGQGCQHDLYGTTSCVAAVAAAKAMKKNGIKGTLKVFGTAAEETLVGKVFMLQAGAFDGTDAIVTWHPGIDPGVEYSSNLAILSVKFQFYGRSAHGAAAPEHGRSALDAVTLMNLGMEHMREHLTEDTRIHFVIPKGGDTPNNVPPFAENYYFIRAANWQGVNHMWNWMKDVAAGAALMTQTKMTYSVLTACHNRLPNKTLAMMGDQVVKAIGAPKFTAEDQKLGQEVVKSLDKDTKGGEAYITKISSPNFNTRYPNVLRTKASNDQGSISWKIPILGFRGATEAMFTPGHSWQLVCQGATPPALKGGLQVGKWMAAAVVEMATNSKLIEDAKTELKGLVTEFGPYVDPLPEGTKLPTFEMLYGIKPSDVPGAKN